MKPWFSATLCMLGACTAAAAVAPGGKVEGKVTLIDNGRPRASSAEVVVWIEATRVGKKKETAASKPKEPAPAMTSEHKKFLPRLLAVPVGDAVAFPNDDPIFHNVFSVSGENRFDLGLYRRGKSKEKTFEKPGLVRVYCNIHPQMVGYVRVVDSDFYAVTKTDGSFSFDGVPPGEHQLKAWCEEGGETSAAVSVKAGKPAPASLTLDVSAFRPEAHKNKYGKDYPPPPPDEDRY